MIGSEDDVMQAAWLSFNQAHPDLAEQILATIMTEGLEQNTQTIVKLAWLSGFYAAMLCYGNRSIVQLSSLTNPAKN